MRLISIEHRNFRIQLVNAKCFPKETDKRGTFADILDEISRIQKMFDV